MSQAPVLRCDCCGLPIAPEAGEDCPRCHYPINIQKEERFLEASICDLQRVAEHGGAKLSVVDLIRRYQDRLNYLHKIQAQTDIAPGIQTPFPEPQAASQIAESQASVPPVALPVMPVMSVNNQANAAPMMPVEQQPVSLVQRPGQVFSFRTFLADQTINIIASLGAFIGLVGALSFVATTTNLWLSFLVLFIVQAVFGGVGISTYRFASFRVVAIIYTVIFALLVPLVGFSGYRLVLGHLVPLSVPTLIALAAGYAAIVYGTLAVYQHFKLFGYLGVVALAVADLAIARDLGLAYWWWPAMLMLLAFPALLALPRPGGSVRPFIDTWAILREPVRVFTFVVAGICALGVVSTGMYSFALDSYGTPLREVRFAILCMTVLLLLWTCLALWLTKRTRWLLSIAYLFLACVLAFCYAFDFQLVGYVLVLTGVALLYHGLTRFAAHLLAHFGRLSLGLDQLALALVGIVPFVSRPSLPLELLTRAYQNPAGVTSHLLFQFHADAIVELLAVALGLGLTISVALQRAGLSHTPDKARAGWCWLLLLSGVLLNWIYTVIVLASGTVPVWSFLGLSLFLVAGAVVVRQRVGAAWANPLDVLALSEIILTVLLSLGQSTDIIISLLLFFATVLYGVLLYQRRWAWLVLPFLLALLALPLLLLRPRILLVAALLLPFAAVVIYRFVTKQRNASPTGASTILDIITGWEWPLVALGLLYGIVISLLDTVSPHSTVQNWTGVAFPVALEIATLALVWYVAAALSRLKFWLLPVIGFAIAALLFPNNSFWALLVVTPLAAVLAVGVSRLADRGWALPLYIVALLGAVMTGYTGAAQHQGVAVTWAMLGFAVLAYAIGVIEDLLPSLWLVPLFATWSVFDAASLLGDLYRPPIVALICAVLGVIISYLKSRPAPLPRWLRWIQSSKSLKYALPFYVTALAAAVLTGIYGMLFGVNYPFYAAIPDALLLYALVAYGVLLFENRPRWLWLVASFAIWGTLLATETNAYYVAAIGLGTGVMGLLMGRLVNKPVPNASLPVSSLARFTWNGAWYLNALLAAFIVGLWSSLIVQQPIAAFTGYALLAFTILAFIVMLVERTPELLVFPALLAVWAIWQWHPALTLVPLMVAYSLLCVLIFVSQFAWKLVSPALLWLPAPRMARILALGGQVLVVFAIIQQGGLSADVGLLAHAGAGALLVLALLLFWYGRLQSLLVMRRWCDYGSGLLASLVVSWELLAFRQTNLDLLTLAPATYLIVIAPLLSRDEALPLSISMRHRARQLASLLGAALLLLPALWLSFGGESNNLLYTLVLMGEALALLLLGIGTRVRIFVLSGAGLVIIGALHALFLPALSIPPSLALTVLGAMLLTIATGLSLARHRIQVAWSHWE